MNRSGILLFIVALVACGDAAVTALGDSGAETGADATVRDAGFDVIADTSSAEDTSPIVDASPDVPCSINVVVVASCQYDAGLCTDFAGPNWSADTPACPDSGTFVWDASCPTLGRVGSCGVSIGQQQIIERCYPPFGPNQCQGLCLILDGGYCPN